VFGRIEEVGGDHGITMNSLEVDMIAFQNDPFVFDVLPNLLHLASFKDGF
jgi:hypothetical protein